jgi:hypothetical protein
MIPQILKMSLQVVPRGNSAIQSLFIIIDKHGAGTDRVEGGGERGFNNRCCRKQWIMRSIVLYLKRELRHPPEIISRTVWAEGDCLKRKWFSNRTVTIGDALRKVKADSPFSNG